MNVRGAVRYGLAGLFALASLLSMSAPADRRAAAVPATRPNVIVITVDTLRADHLPAYGYARDTTPNLDAYVTNQGAVFADVTSPAPWTCPANGGLSSGRDPTRLDISWTSWANALRPDVDTLAEYLHGAGYVSAGFATNGYASARTGFAQGFDYFDGTLVTSTHSIPLATAVTDHAIAWTQTYSASGPLFLWLYYMDPHTWYNPPPPYDVQWDSTYTGTVTPAVYDDGYGVITGQLVLTPRDLQHVLALYDGEISYTDAEIGRMLAYLDSRRLLDNAVIVFTADHGEMFGEHGKWIHANSLYEELLRVPLIVRYTGVITPGLVVTAPVQSMDLMPTLLDYLAIPITGTAPLQGISLRPLIEGPPPDRARPVYSEVDAMNDPNHWAYLNAPRVDLRSMREGDWKYIFHVTEPVSDELYLLNPASPYETINLIQSEPARAARMRQAIMNWFGINRSYLPWSAFLP
jgi:arylsulfatase A-like enzyme